MQSMFVPALAGLLACLSVLALVGGLGSASGERRRMQGLRRRMESRAPKADPNEPRSRNGLVGGLGSGLERLGRTVSPTDAAELGRGRLAMVRAGLRDGALSTYWGVKCLLAAGGILAGVAVRLAAPDAVPTPWLAVGMTAAAMGGFYLPGIWLRMRTSRRRTEMLHSLPDALDLLVVCVESGMGLDQALARVGREMALRSPVLSEELYLLNLELRAGRRRSEALRNLSLRMDLEDVASLVTLLVQADAFGTSVARTLRVYSDTLRTKRRLRAEEMAAKLPVKLLFPLVLFILPALFVVIIGPAAIQLADIFTKVN